MFTAVVVATVSAVLVLVVVLVSDGRSHVFSTGGVDRYDPRIPSRVKVDRPSKRVVRLTFLSDQISDSEADIGLSTFKAFTTVTVSRRTQGKCNEQADGFRLVTFNRTWKPTDRRTLRSTAPVDGIDATGAAFQRERVSKADLRAGGTVELRTPTDFPKDICVAVSVSDYDAKDSTVGITTRPTFAGL